MAEQRLFILRGTDFGPRHTWGIHLLPSCLLELHEMPVDNQDLFCPDIPELFRQADECALSRRCAGGFPTFIVSGESRRTTMRVALLKTAYAERVEVTNAQLGDFRPDLPGSLITAARDYGEQHGYPIAIPAFKPEGGSQVLCLVKSCAMIDFCDLPLDEPVPMPGSAVPMALRLASETAADRQFPAGYPNWHIGTETSQLMAEQEKLNKLLEKGWRIVDQRPLTAGVPHNGGVYSAMAIILEQ